MTRFSGPREFYEFYQDYYHHRSELQAGPLLIHEPAVVEPKREGWRFQRPGLLEVMADQPKPARKIKPSEIQPAADVTAPPTAPPANKIKPSDIETVAPEEAAPAALAANDELPGRVCGHCGSVVEERYSFCWHCGKSMKGDTRGSQTAEAANSPRRLVIDMDDASTAQRGEEDNQSSIFSSEMPRQRKLRRGNSGLKLMLVVVAAAGVLLAVGGALRFRHSASPLDASLTTQAMSANLQSDPNTVPSVDVADKPVVDAGQPGDSARNENERVRPEDDALLKLREKRMAASAADRGNISRDFAKAEKQYPNDYRFPYEHAKLAVAAPQIKSFDAAFKALFAAAERAIKAGKTHEMLQGLQADKSGDFQKLSRGHSEWAQLVQALKNKDTKFLAANTRLAQAM